MSGYYSLVYSHLQYAIIFWGNSYKTIKHKLQNRIIKTLCNKFGAKTRLKPVLTLQNFTWGDAFSALTNISQVLWK